MGAWISHLFGGRPSPSNNTLSQVEEHARMEARRREVEEAQKKEQEARREAEKARQNEEAARREADEAHQKAVDALRKEEEAVNRAKAMEAQAAEAVREKEQLEEKANDALHKLNHGIQPTVWPTAEELASVKARAEYREDRLHFAVCGPSGSGKSSLINALRGLRNGQEGSAKTGVVECTAALQRYPDPRKNIPYSRFVWYDVPGAGTSKIPGWQYFNRQGLFIFDFIILVYDMRFTQIDADILENCRRFKIPAFIVRSKANQHITNMMNDEDIEYTQARSKYVDETRRDLQANLSQYGLWEESDPLPLRIVSNATLYDYTKDIAERDVERETGISLPAEERKGGKKRILYIDEPELVHDLLKTAYERRYSGGGGGGGSIVSSITSGLSKLGKAMSSDP